MMPRDTSTAPQHLRRRTRTSGGPSTATVAACAFSLALLSAATVAVDAQCAEAGRRSRQCGATGSKQLATCCPGLKCEGRRCVEDVDFVADADFEGTADADADAGNDPLADTGTRDSDAQEAETVDLSDLAGLTNTPAPPPTSTPDDGSNAASSLDLLRPSQAVNGLKPSGGISSAIFGTRTTRTWNMLIPPATIQQPDPVQQVTSYILLERDPFKFTEMPSAMPSAGPSAIPTPLPSQHPSEIPSMSPTPAPTAYPTVTMMPTEWLWTSEPVPSNPDEAYFDYNPSSWTGRGPAQWGSVRNSDESKYWGSLQDYIENDLDENQCGNSGSRRQSPIDVRFGTSDGQCFEYHEIRHTAGEFSVADPKVDAQILPTKLRIDYPYVVLDPDDVEDMGNDRPDWTDTKTEDGKVTVKDAVKGPSADIPKGWGYQLPVTHVDIKIPSEHYMEGKQYAAEYQIYLIQNRKAKRGAPVISILIDLDPNDRPNAALQVALDRFQLEWDKDMAECEAKRRKERLLDAILGEGGDAAQDQSTWLDEPEEEERKFQSYLRKAQEAPQGGYTYFDPWDAEIMRNIWFFGYEGSLTEPPCTEFLEWRIIDTPTTVSRAQLFQMKKLLFHHVDGNCKRTSAHYEGSVARPLQPYNGRLVHRCMCRDFIADKQRKQLGVQRCNWKDRDQFGFDKNVFTQDWYDRTHQYENNDHQLCKVWNDCDEWYEELAEQGDTTGGTTTVTPTTPWWWSF